MTFGMPQDQLPHDSQATAAAEPDPALLQHIQSLGLKTTDEYVVWCARHGFSRRTNKDWRQRLKEHSFATRAIANARLVQQKQEARKPEKIIERIFQGELSEDEVLHPSLKAICWAYKSSKSCSQTKQALFRLLLHVVRHADLFSAQPVIPQYGQQEGNTFIGGLLALARHSPSWIRLATAWKSPTHNSHRQFSSLARHLLADWPVPPFMDSVWFKGNSPESLRQQKWFPHLGAGQNIRTADLPLPFTKKMAHSFMQAPPDFTVEAALRWGQIHGLGGNARLVRAILGTRLGANFEQDAFWTTVLLFLITNPMFDLAQVGPVIDYLHHQKFVSQEVFLAPGVVERREPPQPHFTIKGRTPASLLRQVRSWHGELAQVRHPQAQWPRSEIDGFEWIERLDKNETLRIWTIRELTSTHELVAEGQALKHCVATYAQSCLQGSCSIWTLEVETEQRRSKVLTIEVQRASKAICQVRGRCNALPGEKHLGILRRWAEQSGLRLATYA